MVDWESALVVAGAALVSAFAVLAVLYVAIRAMDVFLRKKSPKPASTEAKAADAVAAKTT